MTRFEVAAILFDIDGTLVDSTAAVERTWRVWSDKHELDAEAILRVCHGRRSEDTISDFLPEKERDAAVAEMLALELNDMRDVIALPATSTLLPALSAGRWAAVTSGSRALMQARLAAAGLPVPAVLVAAEDVAQGKPHPEGYLAAAAALGIDPSSCLVVEDAPAGIQAGRAAGAHVLAVATSHELAALQGAHSAVTDLTKIRVTPSQGGLCVDVADEPAETLKEPE